MNRGSELPQRKSTRAHYILERQLMSLIISTIDPLSIEIQRWEKVADSAVAVLAGGMEMNGNLYGISQGKPIKRRRIRVLTCERDPAQLSGMRKREREREEDHRRRELQWWRLFSLNEKKQGTRSPLVNFL
uniref:Uncharacterized protein n=1 Tax=Nelumbo nucifera TaxID=4432 RepID=A0A822ZVN2_NELNU|nr:TPA_asm: hypothetical protein HUJ06_016883 [Nelumbo nucifera]